MNPHETSHSDNDCTYRDQLTAYKNQSLSSPFSHFGIKHAEKNTDQTYCPVSENITKTTMVYSVYEAQDET